MMDFDLVLTREMHFELLLLRMLLSDIHTLCMIHLKCYLGIMHTLERYALSINCLLLISTKT